MAARARYKIRWITRSHRAHFSLPARANPIEHQLLTTTYKLSRRVDTREYCPSPSRIALLHRRADGSLVHRAAAAVRAMESCDVVLGVRRYRMSGRVPVPSSHTLESNWERYLLHATGNVTMIPPTSFLNAALSQVGGNHPSLL